MKKEGMNSYNKARPTSAPVLRSSKLTTTVLTSDKGNLHEGEASEDKSQSKWQIRKSYLINFMMNSMIYMI